MKKELFALLTMLALAVGAVINILHLKKLVEEMDTHITASEKACQMALYAQGEAHLNTALELWLESDGYTHIFIRHTEIDSTADAFYEALEGIRAEDFAAASAGLGKLQYHLQSILTIEYVTLRSVC